MGTTLKLASVAANIMKLYASVLFAGYANAGFQAMREQMGDLTQRYVRSLIEANRPQPRAISDILTGDNFDRVNEYGCWCYFENDHGRGHGKPVNGIDHFCKKLADGYDCCMLDFEESTGNDSCVPWEVQYLPGTGTGEVNLAFNCDGFNNINTAFCANCACKVEGIFVLKVFNLFIAGGGIDEQYMQPTFDEKAGCHWSTVSKTQNELAAEPTHTDSHTSRFPENEVAAVTPLLILLFKNVARITLPESPVN